MAKKKDLPKKFRVFGFMKNQHTLLVIAEDGRKMHQVEVESETQAKDVLMSEMLNAQLINALEATEFSTIWIDDPAGDPDVMAACAKMEAAPAPDTTEPESEAPQEIKVHTAGMVFQTKCDGEFINTATGTLKVGDICRFFPQNDAVDPTLWEITTAPESDGAEDFYLSVKKYVEPTAEAQEQAIEEAPAPTTPQFKLSGKTKIIDVECPATPSEMEKDKLIRTLQAKKIEAQAVAAEYREEIKDIEKRLFALVNGKSFTRMECTIIEDWDGGERRYIRPDTGEVALIEKIPFEERQLNMNAALEEATPKPLTYADGTPVQEDPTPETEESTDEGAAEPVVDEDNLTPEAVADATQGEDQTSEQADFPEPEPETDGGVQVETEVA